VAGLRSPLECFTVDFLEAELAMRVCKSDSVLQLGAASKSASLRLLRQQCDCADTKRNALAKAQEIFSEWADTPHRRQWALPARRSASKAVI